MIRHTKPRLAALGLCACCALNLAPHPLSAAFDAAPTRKISIGGVFVLLREQRAGAFVLDARLAGRGVPGCVKAPSNANAAQMAAAVPIAARAVVLLGDGLSVQEAALLLAARDKTERVLLTPERLLEAPDRRGVHQLSPAQMFAKLRHESNPILLDFSEAEEWRWAHLCDSRHVETARLLRGDRSFLAGHECDVYLTCVAGHRSQLAAQILGREGFRVWNLRGGMMEWQSCGLPVERSPAKQEPS